MLRRVWTSGLCTAWRPGWRRPKPTFSSLHTTNDCGILLRTLLPQRLRISGGCRIIYSLGFSRVLKRKMPVAGATVPAGHLRGRNALDWRGTISFRLRRISCRFLRRLACERRRARSSRNWAQVDEINARPHDNDWKRETGPRRKLSSLITARLALKHNPALLSHAALTT